MSLPESRGRKLYLLQKSDPFKEWWSLGEMRRCVKCGALFTGFDIRLDEDAEEVVHFHCPTSDCDGSWEHWEYPELHL